MVGGCQWYSGAAWFSPKVDQGQVAVRAIVEILPDFNLAIRGALASRPSTVVGSWRSIAQLGCCFNELKPSCGRVLKDGIPKSTGLSSSILSNILNKTTWEFFHISQTHPSVDECSLPACQALSEKRLEGECSCRALGMVDFFGMDLLTQGIGKMDVCHQFYAFCFLNF